MQQSTTENIEEISGGMSDWTAVGMAVIGIGLGGGPVTGVFGLLVGGAMMNVGHYDH